MLIKSIINLLQLYEGSETVNFTSYNLAMLQLAGFVDDDENITDQGRVIVLDILTRIERVL